jgi:perosamine synthetase
VSTASDDSAAAVPLVRLSDVRFDDQAEELVLSVLRSGQVAQGPMVERFESLCAAMAGTSHAVAVANGTVSLEAALHVLGVGPGDEVITTPLTFAATLNAILRSGATARFADVDGTYTLDPHAVSAVVGPATAAILPVHLYGLPADMAALSSLTTTHGLAMVEDAAHAHGASVGGRPVGSFGLGSFSFYATKNVTTGEGGVVTTSDDEIARRLRVLRNQGMSAPYRYEMVGANLRMTDLQAALGVSQLQRLHDITSTRARNAAALTALLAEAAPSVTLPSSPDGRGHAWHLYTVLLPEGVNREVVAQRMADAGVQTGTYYPALVWDHPPYRDHSRVVVGETPQAAFASSRCLSLPIQPRVRDDDLERVATALGKAMA